MLLSVVQQSGRTLNLRPQVEALIDLLLDPVGRRARQRVLRAIEGERDRQPQPELQERLRQGVSQQAVYAVLAEAGQSLSPVEVRERVSASLRRDIPYGTVASTLHLAAKNPDMPVERIGEGQYKWLLDA